MQAHLALQLRVGELAAVLYEVLDVQIGEEEMAELVEQNVIVSAFIDDPKHVACFVRREVLHTDGGGEMAPSGTPPSYVDVEPTAGTLVLFRSDVPHEVLDTSASRLAMVGWFNSPPEGSNERRTLIAALAGALLVGSGVKTILGGGGGK